MRDFVFLDPGADVTRRDIYRLGRAKGMRVVLVSRKVGWETAEIDEWIEANPADPTAVLAELAGRSDVAGVVNCSESCLPTAAAIAEVHGLPGLRPEVVQRCRDKVVMGERLTAAGVPMARRRVVTTVEDAVTAARDVGPPGVLKPSTGVASLFTVRFDTVEQVRDNLCSFEAMLAERVPESLRHMAGRWLIEEYLDGTAFSVESVVSAGVVRHVAICEKGPISGPYFREIGHNVPARLSTGDQATLTEFTERSIHAMGIDDCVTHTEFKWSGQGPRLLEIGARIGGGSIRQVVREATGVDLIDVTLELAMGYRPAVHPVTGPAAASRSLYPAEPGTIVHIDTTELTDLPGVVAVNNWMREGDVYRLPPNGYGEVVGVVTTGRDVDSAIRVADAAIELAAKGTVLAP